MLGLPKQSMMVVCSEFLQVWLAGDLLTQSEYCEIHIDLDCKPEDMRIFSKNGKDATADRRALDRYRHHGAYVEEHVNFTQYNPELSSYWPSRLSLSKEVYRAWRNGSV